MESFSEERFPTDISYGMSGGPNFKTDIVTTGSGYEYRNIRHISPRYKYNLASAIKTEAQLHQVVSFFKVMRGKAIGFRFKDWLDYRAVEQNLAIADGKQTAFQLYKIYQSGASSIKRKITKPVVNTVEVFIEGVRADKLSIDYKTGMILFNNAPAQESKISVSFEFDVPVRFDNDIILTTMQNHGVQLVEDIALIEVQR